MPTFATVPSTRLSTRASPAAISSTARWRSSIRPCSETAKSTRSSLPPPSMTSWERRTRLSGRHARIAAASARTATAPAAIAIAAVVVVLMPRATLLRRQREDHRVLGGVVRRAGLVRHRGDLDRHLRRDAELGHLDVPERHRRLFLRIDERDRLVLDDRGRRALRDRQRHRDLELGRVAGVLDGDREAEVRARYNG